MKKLLSILTLGFSLTSIIAPANSETISKTAFFKMCSDHYGIRQDESTKTEEIGGKAAFALDDLMNPNTCLNPTDDNIKEWQTRLKGTLYFMLQVYSTKTNSLMLFPGANSGRDERYNDKLGGKTFPVTRISIDQKEPVLIINNFNHLDGFDDLTVEITFDKIIKAMNANLK